MRRFAWTCAAGVFSLVCACDTDNAVGDVAERAAVVAEEDCDRGCGDEGAVPERELARPLPADLIEDVARDDRPAQGHPDAKLEILVFNDFECPYCRKEVAVLEDVLATYGNDVRLVFKQFPLPMHDAAEPAARASLAAHRQGKFWAMHDALFEQPERVRAGELAAIAGEVGLDVARFERDLQDPAIAAAVTRDVEDARELGIRGTPSMVVGDKLVVGAQPLLRLREVIDAELARVGRPV
jgi:protein-disulfide isomerase